MNCEHCGQNIPVESQRLDPWCMYQIKDGKVISQLFDPLAIPDGWYDSPKAAKEPVKVKRTRRTKEQIEADNDNSTGTNRQLG